MDAINQLVAKNLKKLRMERGLSQDDLARVSGISKSMLVQIERGTANPSLSTLQKLVNGMQVPFDALLRRPEVHYRDLAQFDPDFPDLPEEVAEQVEIRVKYEGYIQRQLQEVADFQKMEDHALPPALDYSAIQGLRLEAREKLQAVRPLNLGQASRISGVSPADIAALMIYLERG